MLLLFFRLFRQTTVNGLAEPAPGFAAVLTEAAVRAGVLFGNRLFLHIFYYMPAGLKGQRMREYELSQAGRMWYFN